MSCDLAENRRVAPPPVLITRQELSPKSMRNSLLALCAAFLVSSAFAQVPIKWSQRPVWTFDLQASPEYAARMERVRRIFRPSLPRPQLAFLNANTLAVSFCDGSWQHYPVNTPRGFFRFRTFFIDTESHALTGPNLAWPTPDDDSALLPLADGGFFVLAGGQLIRYSSDFQMQKQAPVPADPGNEGEEFETINGIVTKIADWKATEDPEEKVVTLMHSVWQKRTTYFWIDPESLRVLGVTNNKGDKRRYAVELSKTPTPRVVGSFSPERMRHGAILPASEAVIYNAWGQPMIPYKDGSWQRFCSAFQVASWAYAASEDKFFVRYSRNRRVRYALVNSDCRVLLDLPGINNGEVDATSLSGNRIAISDRRFGSTSFFSRAMQAELSIRVWDLDPPGEILKLTLSQRETGAVVRGMDDFGMAISPDGKLLAVLVDSTLMLYAI